MALLNVGCTLDSDERASCLPVSVYGLQVTVTNGLGPSGQCDVTVSAVDGSYSETLDCQVELSSCSCVGAMDRPGTYQVKATRSDGGTAERAVTVGSGECGVVQASTTLELPVT
jgi:hypothetical protein